MYSKSLSNDEQLVPISNPRTWVPYMSTKDCSQGFCSLYCPQWCYIIFPPPPPFEFPDDDSSPNFSPLVIAIIGILASAFLLVSYYAIISKYCGNRNVTRRRENNQEDSELEDEDHDPSNHEPWHVNPGGLDEALIKSITVFKYKKGGGLLTEGTDCSVCLSEFQDDESLRLLPKCSHAFHVMCIDTWLKSHSNCPLCRANIIFPNASPPPIMEITPLTNEPTPQLQPENDIEMGIREEEDVTSHINQEFRRSVSMDYGSQGRLSIADVLGIDHEEFQDCVMEESQLQRDVGTSKLQDNNGEEMSRSGIRNNVLTHCVASPMVMKRSLSSGRLLFLKRGRGQNIVIPLSNI
ncbi:E3 ubiquitin-protein ligase Os04g0590900-like [Nicotiana tabacum]|uniref:RING-type E3 ubiquitin transferase n=3 Tax=Nicotiana TaxID=4085 RepID=A0A1S3ZDV0_TOBAC|nr:PREDICTED: E3 ubiquitin-protein ligase Os04g0590900-like [Nicotiana sylvestris]XP_009787128.1 PREDICTED: E3 ubiquitin-protein ligase Os04g0590900-like [Nicotiana sylvestris]XP_016462618.1 PREDICTED: E3 ubiquitin-protein ligase Os04g0590900-like [Nicotiana tabacum]XP_016462619.1 PREDICTED: E3 ubiquitin-protein ligase Os04g0590900-like [Nicotiana tabacum]